MTIDEELTLLASMTACVQRVTEVLLWCAFDPNSWVRLSPEGRDELRERMELRARAREQAEFQEHSRRQRLAVVLMANELGRELRPTV